MEEQTLVCENCGNEETIVVVDANADNSITCPNCGEIER